MPFRACSLTYLPASASLRSALSMRTWILFALLISDVVWGQSQRTQSFALTEGWNAIFLEVDPLESDPSKLFAELPIDRVAAYVPSKQGAQFVENPSAQLLNVYGWSVWYAPQRSDAFLSSLYAIYGRKAYLIHTTSETNWSVEGTFTKAEARWIPDAYNLVGYSMQTPGGPTFKQFFEASKAHNHNKIYRLVDGIWRQVLDPASTLMRSGEAFWIHCVGHSDYPGPLELATTSHLGLVLSSRRGAELVLRNRTAHPLALALEHRIEGNASVPLSMPTMTFDEESKVLRTVRLDLGSGNWTQDLPTLGPGAGIRLPLKLRLQDMTPGTRSSLLTVHSDMGTLNPISVTVTRDDSP